MYNPNRKQAGRKLDPFTIHRNAMKALRSDARKLETIEKKFRLTIIDINKQVKMLKEHKQDKEQISSYTKRVSSYKEKVNQLHKMILDMRIEANYIRDEIDRQKAYDVDDTKKANNPFIYHSEILGADFELFSPDDIKLKSNRIARGLLDDGNADEIEKEFNIK